MKKFIRQIDVRWVQGLLALAFVLGSEQTPLRAMGVETGALVHGAEDAAATAAKRAALDAAQQKAAQEAADLAAIETKEASGAALTDAEKATKDAADARLKQAVAKTTEAGGIHAPTMGHPGPPGGAPLHFDVPATDVVRPSSAVTGESQAVSTALERRAPTPHDAPATTAPHVEPGTAIETGGEAAVEPKAGSATKTNLPTPTPPRPATELKTAAGDAESKAGTAAGDAKPPLPTKPRPAGANLAEQEAKQLADAQATAESKLAAAQKQLKTRGLSATAKADAEKLVQQAEAEVHQTTTAAAKNTVAKSSKTAIAEAKKAEDAAVKATSAQKTAAKNLKDAQEAEQAAQKRLKGLAKNSPELKAVQAEVKKATEAAQEAAQVAQKADQAAAKASALESATKQAVQDTKQAEQSLAKATEDAQKAEQAAKTAADAQAIAEKKLADAKEIKPVDAKAIKTAGDEVKRTTNLAKQAAAKAKIATESATKAAKATQTAEQAALKAQKVSNRIKNVVDNAQKTRKETADAVAVYQKNNRDLYNLETKERFKFPKSKEYPQEHARLTKAKAETRKLAKALEAKEAKVALEEKAALKEQLSATVAAEQKAAARDLELARAELNAAKGAGDKNAVKAAQQKINYAKNRIDNGTGYAKAQKALNEAETVQKAAQKKFADAQKRLKKLGKNNVERPAAIDELNRARTVEENAAKKTGDANKLLENKKSVWAKNKKAIIAGGVVLTVIIGAGIAGAVMGSGPSGPPAISSSALSTVVNNLPTGFTAATGMTFSVACGSRNGQIEAWSISADAKKLLRYDTTQAWVSVPALDDQGKDLGILIFVSVSSDGELMVINGQGLAYRYDWDKKNFTAIPMSSAYQYDQTQSAFTTTGFKLTLNVVSVGSKNDIWGVDAQADNNPSGCNVIYKFNLTTNTWDPVAHGVRVSAGVDGTVVGIDTNNAPIMYAGQSNWNVMPGTKLDHIAVSNKGYIYGSYQGTLWQYTNNAWVQINGADGKPAMGINEIAVNAAGSIIITDGNGNIWNNVAGVTNTSGATQTTAGQGTTGATTGAATTNIAGAAQTTQDQGAQSTPGATTDTLDDTSDTTDTGAPDSSATTQSSDIQAITAATDASNAATAATLDAIIADGAAATTDDTTSTDGTGADDQSVLDSTTSGQ